MTGSHDQGGEAEPGSAKYAVLIELLAKKIGGTASSAAGAAVRAERRRHAERWLKAFVEIFGVLPTGQHDLGRTTVHDLNVGTVDFDELNQDRDVRELLDPPDDDDDEVDSCPVCGSDSGCDHLVATIDFQYGEIQAGALCDVDDPLESCIKEAFQAAYASGNKRPPFYRSKRLAELYRATEIEQDDEECQVSIPGAPLARLLTDLLLEAGAAGDVRELNQGPGWTWEIAELFAPDPDLVIERCRQLLRAELDGKVQRKKRRK